VNTGIGAPVPRLEDERLLTGRGRFSDDLNLPGQAYACLVRSPHAHARILSIDGAAASRARGVLAVLTGADYVADGLKPMPAWGNPKDVELKNRAGRPVFYTPLYPLAVDKVRRVGEAVVMVVAETAEGARDAAELVGVDYATLASAADPMAAMATAAEALWEEVPRNISVDDGKGDEAATDAAFAAAAHVVTAEFINNRVTGVPMEPRAAVGVYHGARDRFELFAGGQGVIRFRTELAVVFGVPPERIRVVNWDVGGGFGTRNHTYPEFALVLWAAKRTGRPVKWTCLRSEAFLSDYAGRDLITRAELAFDADGRILAMRSENLANIGTHTISFVPLARGPSVLNGVYRLPHAHVVSKAVYSNTLPTASYRGAGRPESMFVLERLLDMAAAETGLDRIEIRRRNMIAPADIPYTNPVGTTYDSGAFETSMDMALRLADWDGFGSRRKASGARGRLRGIGLANYIETATGYPQERGEMEVVDGAVVLVMGTQSSGQGHETSYAQIVSHWLGVPIETVELRTGDTDFVSMGSGSHSSRSMRLAGHLYRQTTDDIINQGKAVAAEALEAALDDMEFHDGRFTVTGTDRSLGLFEVAAVAERQGAPLRAAAEIAAPMPAYPNGCHICEVEVDPETGGVELVAYAGVDDVGTVINPLIVDGQTHGGIAQGVGQALMEDCTHDGNGQVLAGSLIDYAMPRADQFPGFELEFNPVPAPSTTLGVKGGGEGGATAAPPALINAIVHALSEFGVRHLDMPATPERIWRAIDRTKSSKGE
jgi:carbon-monoxide dehydrogenase large subunit